MVKKLFIAFLLLLFTVSQGHCVDEWDKTDPAGTASPADIDTLQQALNAALDRFMSYGRFEAILSYSSASQLTVGVGTVICNNSDVSIRRTRTNTAATTVTWSDIDTGSEEGSTTYYVYAVADTDAAAFTIKISKSSSAPSGITYYRRLGYFYNDASSNITQIVNDNASGNIAYIKGQGNFYKIDSGSVSVTSGSTAAVSFSFNFAAAPIVVTSGQFSSNPNDGTDIFIQGAPTTTGFTAGADQTSGTAHWIAIGQVLAQ